MKKVILEKDPDGVQRIILIEESDLDKLQIGPRQDGLFTGVFAGAFSNFYKRNRHLFRSFRAGMLHWDVLSIVWMLTLIGFLAYAGYWIMFVLFSPHLFR